MSTYDASIQKALRTQRTLLGRREHCSAGPQMLATVGGTDQQRALSPFGAQAYSEESEVLGPISSTNTSRPASTFSATITCQTALNHSSRFTGPTVLFSD
jgi:hypothetical protein